MIASVVVYREFKSTTGDGLDGVTANSVTTFIVPASHLNGRGYETRVHPCDLTILYIPAFLRGIDGNLGPCRGILQVRVLILALMSKAARAKAGRSHETGPTLDTSADAEITACAWIDLV